eukprot:4762322-Pyramimonas_sp.AAC.1
MAPSNGWCRTCIIPLNASLRCATVGYALVTEKPVRKRRRRANVRNNGCDQVACDYEGEVTTQV